MNTSKTDSPTLIILAFSRQGCQTALAIRDALKDSYQECLMYTMEKYVTEEFSPIIPPVSRFTGPLFGRADTLIFVGAAGIAVRAIAPYVRDKRTDPAVLVVDELATFVISLLSGHIGGANQETRRLAGVLGAVPVITTATDVNHKFSVDSWAAGENLYIASMKRAKDVSAAILEQPVPICSDFPIVTALPPGTRLAETVSGTIIPAGTAPCDPLPAEPIEGTGICISCRDQKPFTRTCLLVPRLLHLGIGCRKGTPAAGIENLVETVLKEHNLRKEAIKAAASIDLKSSEDGLLEFCEKWKLPVSFYSADELLQAEGSFTSSSFVKSVTGVDNVCERAALLNARRCGAASPANGSPARLMVHKTARDGVTAAIAIEGWEVRFS